jgi:CxxC-x17-CxxC domain-containing protein
MAFRDKQLTCKECGAEFVFSVGEQQFFADCGFKNQPKRCKDCRHKRNLAPRPNISSSTAVSTSTNCSECGKETTVPFRPAPGRPVFCRECFHAVSRDNHGSGKTMHVS